MREEDYRNDELHTQAEEPDWEIVDLNPEEETADKDGAVSKQEEPVNMKKEVLSWILTFAITLGIVFILKHYIIINALVPSGSMENLIMPGDQLFGNRLAYLAEGPKRGDVIFFYFPDDETQRYVKRVIGLPGEKVVISDAKIYINGSETPLDEPYLKEEWVRGTGTYEYEVPEGCYFVLGDNRNTSIDARYWNNTYVAREKIIGKAMLIYWPLDRIGIVE